MPSKKTKNRKLTKSRSKKASTKTKLTSKSQDSQQKAGKKPVRRTKMTSLAKMTTSQSQKQVLLENEKKYKALIEQSLQGIVVIQDFRIIFANTAITKISGYTKKELLSFSPEQLRSIIYPEDQMFVWKRYQDRLSGKSIPPHQEYRIKRKDGTIAWIETLATVIEYGGKPAIQATLIDITSHKMTEAALEETNKLLETLLDHTHMMVAYLDPQFNFVRVNRAYAKADEREPSFFPGKNHFDLYPNQENEEIFRRVVNTGKPYFTYAKPFKYAEHPERGVTYWDWSLIPIKDPADVVVGLVLTIVNVTKQKQADLQLQKTAHDLRERLKEIDCLYGISNIVETTGVPLEDMLQGIVDLIPSGWQYPEITCARITMNDRIFKTKNFSQTIWKQSSDIIVYGDRIGTLEVCYLEEKPKINEGPFVQEERNLINAIAMRLGKVAERQRAEEALRESEEKFRNLAEQSPNMIFINKKGKVVYANKKCQEIMGYTREEFYSPDFDFFRLIAPESQDLIKASFNKHIKGKEVHPYEYTLITKGGEKIEAILTSKLIRYEGENAILGTVTDITERKQAEKEIEKLNEGLKLQAQELAAANKELEAFSYSVSHDLRAPLRTIDGFSRALLEDYSNKLDESGKDYLRRVRAGTQQMRQLIDNLLNLSLAIRAQITREEINLSKLVQKIATDLEKSQPERKVQFAIQENVFARGDPQLLQNVLENLLNNSWKFTEKHLQARIEFGATQKVEQTAYFVRDDGAGFDMTYVNKLFIPFQRLHSADEFSGDGIGLAIAKRIINRHGGRIWAEGEVEKGATFYFTLT